MSFDNLNQEKAVARHMVNFTSFKNELEKQFPHLFYNIVFGKSGHIVIEVPYIVISLMDYDKTKHLLDSEAQRFVKYVNTANDIVKEELYANAVLPYVFPKELLITKTPKDVREFYLYFYDVTRKFNKIIV